MPVYQQVEGGTIAKDIEPGQIKLFGRHTGRLFLHPSCVLFSAAKYPGTYLAFARCMRTSKVRVGGAIRHAVRPRAEQH